MYRWVGVNLFSLRSGFRFLFGASSFCALHAAEVACIGTPPRAEPTVRIERVAVQSDADLTTLFLTPGEPGAREIPVLSFLRDKLGIRRSG